MRPDLSDYLCMVLNQTVANVTLTAFKLVKIIHQLKKKKIRQCIKKQRHYFANNDPYNQSFGFSSSHVWMWELDHKEGWAPKNWCFWTEVLEKTLESPLDCREIKPVNLKGNKSWIFIGRTDAKDEAPILWPPDVYSWFIRKDPDAGKDWGQEEKGLIEDEMVGWHHQLSEHEFEHAPGDGEGQGCLAFCSSWCCKESDMSEWLNNKNKQILSTLFSFLL